MTSLEVKREFQTTNEHGVSKTDKGRLLDQIWDFVDAQFEEGRVYQIRGEITLRISKVEGV